MSEPTPDAAPVTKDTSTQRTPRPARPRSAPALPDETTATKEDWQDFQGEFAGWVQNATDDELLAEMAAIPTDGRPLSPNEAWRYHQCELRRRLPRGQRGTPVARKKG